MRLDCAHVEEAIWNTARGEHELTTDEFHHIERCHSCKQAMADAKAGLAALGILKPCPPAPDCRDWIMSRINPVRPIKSRMRFAWAAVPVCAVVILAALFFSINNRRVEIAKPVASIASRQRKAPSADRSAHVRVAQKPAQVRQANVAAVQSRITPQKAPHKHRHVSIALRNTLSHKPIIAKVSKARTKLGVAKQVASAPPKPSESSSAVKAVSLTWSPGFGNGEVSYQYTEEDKATGEVIIRHTTIRDNSIDVRVESTKAPQKPTSKMLDQSKATDSGMA
ncbi:MAG: hypothetical protein ABFD83_02025 [Armatimonadota bacterium]